jgi:hypothetical protein
VTTERQKAANQANARLSTGPKTSKGKTVVRFNALGHGLLARDVVLPEEDADAFEDVRNQVRANLSPVGPRALALSSPRRATPATGPTPQSSLTPRFWIAVTLAAGDTE